MILENDARVGEPEAIVVLMKSPSGLCDVNGIGYAPNWIKGVSRGVGANLNLANLAAETIASENQGHAGEYPNRIRLELYQNDLARISTI